MWRAFSSASEGTTTNRMDFALRLLAALLFGGLIPAQAV